MHWTLPLSDHVQVRVHLRQQTARLSVLSYACCRESMAGALGHLTSQDIEGIILLDSP